jgi:hypothetical protein
LPSSFTSSSSSQLFLSLLLDNRKSKTQLPKRKIDFCERAIAIGYFLSD